MTDENSTVKEDDNSEVIETSAAEKTEASPAEKTESIPEPKEKSSSKTKAAPAKKRTSSPKPWGLVFVFLLVLALGGALVYVVMQGQVLLGNQEEKILALQNQLEEKNQTNRKLYEQLAANSQRLNEALSQKINASQTQYQDLNQRVSAQAKRLRAMSDTSREDWLLAEAEYLLKLANQRVRIERSPIGAEALLEEADIILRDLDDPDLLVLRRAVAKDLAALRVVSKIDVEGIYLSLVALAEQIEKLPMQTFSINKEEQTQVQQNQQTTEDPSMLGKLKASIGRFFNKLKHVYRVIPADEMPKRILPPESKLYLQQNLRLFMERAQLALLREQQQIYQQSLVQADAWLVQYYNDRDEVSQFREELIKLSSKKIVQELPDISNSLKLLHEYIENLHNLKGLNVSNNIKPAASATTGGN